MRILLWALLALLALAVTALARIVLGGRSPSRSGRWMRMIYIGGSFPWVRGGEWKESDPPDVFAEDGPLHLKPYVERLLASNFELVYLMLITPDGQRGFSIRKRRGRIGMGFFARPGSAKDVKLRSFFATRGIEPDEDRYIRLNQIQTITWPMPADLEDLNATAVHLLAEVFDVPSSGPLTSPSPSPK